jgi:hypothetical protein
MEDAYDARTALPDFDALTAALAARQHGVVSRAQLRALHGERLRWRIEHRLVTGRWIELHPFVYAIAGMANTYEQRLSASVLALPASVASRRAAAALHGVPGFTRALLEVSSPRARRKGRFLDGVVVHYSTLLPDAHRKAVDGIPTTTVARTLFDLCAVVHPGRAERAVDNCLSRKWVTMPALWRVLDDLAIQGRNGTCAMREILQARGEGYVAPASDIEAEFLALLRRAGLPLPAREINLGDADQWIGRVEFVYRTERVLIEVDGRLHHSALLDFENDRERDNRFAAEGYRVLRVTYSMMKERPRDVERIVRRALRVAA